MNLKAASKYQLKSTIIPIIVFYLTIICFFSFIYVSIASSHLVAVTKDTSGKIIEATNNASHMNFTFGGASGFTLIFLFILALNSFKENFRLLIQNGLSRKAILLSRTITTIILAAGLALLDEIIYLTFSILSRAVKGGSVTFNSLFEQAYQLSRLHPAIQHIIITFYAFFLYLGFMALGYFITLLFYRLNNIGKIAVGAGVPIFICVILPILDRYADNRIYKSISVFTENVLGRTSNQLLYGMLSFFLMFILFSGFCWLLMKRAPLRE